MKSLDPLSELKNSLEYIHEQIKLGNLSKFTDKEDLFICLTHLVENIEESLANLERK